MASKYIVKIGFNVQIIANHKGCACQKIVRSNQSINVKHDVKLSSRLHYSLDRFRFFHGFHDFEKIMVNFINGVNLWFRT